MINTETRYGFVTKALHWTVFLLLVHQFVTATAMLNTGSDETTAGLTQSNFYDWHKSVGLIVLAVVIVRLAWRKLTPLPDWAPNLSAGEKRAIAWIERVLYVCLFLMPISGFLFVMAGDYGVKFFGRWDLPNVVGVNETLASLAQLTHEVTAVLLVLTLLAHWGMGIRHHLAHRDRYLHRMLPFTHQR